MFKADVIIVGAGPVGCVLANKIATELNLSCLIIAWGARVARRQPQPNLSSGTLSQVPRAFDGRIARRQPQPRPLSAGP